MSREGSCTMTITTKPTSIGTAANGKEIGCNAPGVVARPVAGIVGCIVGVVG